MPDERPPIRPTSNPPAQPESSSLADLLPEFFESPQSAPTSAQPAPVEPLGTNDPQLIPVQTVPVKPRQKGFNYVPLVIVAVVGMIVVPLVILGVFIFIANNQPTHTTIDVASATTPLPTVFSITPGAAATTAPAANGTAPASSPGASAAAKSPAPTANPCPPRTVFGSVELYTCSQVIQANTTFTNYIGLAEVQMAQAGQNGPAANRVYAVSGDSPAKVMQFYVSSLAAQGFAPVKGNETGSTSLGPYTAALYAKGNQQVQVAVLTVNKASPDGQVNNGQTLIRLSSS